MGHVINSNIERLSVRFEDKNSISLLDFGDRFFLKTILEIENYIGSFLKNPFFRLMDFVYSHSLIIYSGYNISVKIFFYSGLFDEFFDRFVSNILSKKSRNLNRNYFSFTYNLKKFIKLFILAYLRRFIPHFYVCSNLNSLKYFSFRLPGTANYFRKLLNYKLTRFISRKRIKKVKYAVIKKKKFNLLSYRVLNRIFLKKDLILSLFKNLDLKFLNLSLYSFKQLRFVAIRVRNFFLTSHADKFYFIFNRLSFLFRSYYIHYTLKFALKLINKALSKIIFKDYRFLKIRASFVSLRRDSLTPKVMVSYISRRLQENANLISILYPLIQSQGSFNSGFRVKCSGRFTRKQRAWHINIQLGNIPLNNLGFSIGFSKSITVLKYGVGGLKVWLLPVDNRFLNMNKHSINLFYTFKSFGFLKLSERIFESIITDNLRFKNNIVVKN